MNCHEMVDFLMAYVDDELPAAQREAFNEHLEACPPCISYVDSYRESVRIGKAVCERADGPVPDDVPEALIQAILVARQR